MNVLCVFPVAYYHANVPDIWERFERKIAPALFSSGAARVELAAACLDYAYAPPENEGGAPKRVVRTMSAGIARCVEQAAVAPDCVLMCVGSGKIPYELVEGVFRELVEKDVDCVMGHRTGANKGVADWRFFVERFEAFVLQKHFNHSHAIPDGQCGLWGYRAGPLERGGRTVQIKRTAQGYEGELDLLSEVLEKGLSYSFLPVELPGPVPKTTFFPFDQYRKNLAFLCRKYPDLRAALQGYMDAFVAERKDDLAGLSGEVRGQWDKYREMFGAFLREK